MKKTFGWEAKHLQITKKQVQPLNSRWPRLLPCRLYQSLRGENQLLLQKSTWQRHDSSSYPQNCHLAPIHMRHEQIIFCIAPPAAPLPTRKLIAWGSIVRSKAIIEINCRVIIGKHFSPHSICENGRGVMLGFQLSAPAPDHLVSLQVSTPDIHQLVSLQHKSSFSCQIVPFPRAQSILLNLFLVPHEINYNQPSLCIHDAALVLYNDCSVFEETVTGAMTSNHHLVSIPNKNWNGNYYYYY